MGINDIAFHSKEVLASSYMTILLNHVKYGYDETHYVVCSSPKGSSSKEVTIDGIYTEGAVPRLGCRLVVKFEYGNSASDATLIVVGSTTAIAIEENGKPLSSLSENTLVELVYDTVWQVVGTSGGELSDRVGDLENAVFPFGITLKNNYGGLFLYGSKVDETIEWTGKRKGVEVTIDSVDYSYGTLLSTNSLGVSITSPRMVSITAHSGDMKDTVSVTYDFAYYVYYGEVTTLPDSSGVVDAIKSLNRTLSNATTWTSAVTGGKGYIFACRGEKTFKCYDDNSGSTLVGFAQGRCTITRTIYTGETVDDIYSYVVIPKGSTDWKLRIE